MPPVATRLVPRAPARGKGGETKPPYDRAFEPAVADGLLTPRAAKERGSRYAYALSLVSRHGISTKAAFDVADNRMLLKDALEQSVGVLPATGRWSTGERLAVGVLLILAAVLAGWIAQTRWNRHAEIARAAERASLAAARSAPPVALAEAEPARPGAVRVKRDELDRITQVSAGRPDLVLEELCRLAGHAGACPAVELLDAAPRTPGHRVGRFPDPTLDDLTWAVPIRRDRASGRWVAGTGLRPIQAVPIETSAADPATATGSAEAPGAA